MIKKTMLAIALLTSLLSVNANAISFDAIHLGNGIEIRARGNQGVDLKLTIELHNVLVIVDRKSGDSTHAIVFPNTEISIHGSDHDDRIEYVSFLPSLSNKIIFYGGGGNDLLISGAPGTEMHGGDGDDTLRGSFGNDLLFGDDGDDVLIGGAGDDELFGGNGNDTLEGGDGDDLLKGEEGDDLLFGETAIDAFAAKLADKQIGSTKSLSSSIESPLIELPLLGVHDVLDGGNGDDDLFGGIGDDDLTGGNGFDCLRGGDGNDFLNPGSDPIEHSVIGGRGADIGIKRDLVEIPDGKTNRNVTQKFVEGFDLGGDEGDLILEGPFIVNDAEAVSSGKAASSSNTLSN